MAGEFVEREIPPQKDCSESSSFRYKASTNGYHYIFKFGNKKETDYPPEACPPWYHATAQIDSLQVNTSGIIGTGLM